VYFILPASDEFNLQCSLADASTLHRYAFHIEIPKFLRAPRVVWVAINTYDLRVVRVDDTMIIANLDTKLSDWPDKADSMSFQFNRITGEAEMNYLQKPTETDPFPGWLIMKAFSENGTCSKSKRAF
jgi:hypothetical protein